MNKLKEIFKREACELLSKLESELLELEASPDDGELIASVFRILHTLKGSGGMFGFNELTCFTHELETVFNLVREGSLPVSTELINLTLMARDHIKILLDTDMNETSADSVNSNLLIGEMRRLAQASGHLKTEFDPLRVSPGMNATDTSGIHRSETNYFIRFRPHEDIFSSGTNLLLLLEELSELGRCRIFAHVGDIPLLADLNSEACHIGWDIFLFTDKGISAIRGVFLFVEDRCKLRIHVMGNSGQEESDEDDRKMAQTPILLCPVSSENQDEVPDEQPSPAQMMAEDRIAESALLEQNSVRESHRKPLQDIDPSSIRVAADKLDRLVDLVGEMVTVQARLRQKAAGKCDPEWMEIIGTIEGLMSELRNNTMKIRMQPVSTAFGTLRRLVRDLSKTLGKEVAITTDGGETELDKTVIENLSDPLVHIIRNCLDHGIEMPDVREALEKPRMGSIHLSAKHVGANVVIRISDDGSGLNPDAIRQKAVAKGFIRQNSNLSDKQLFSLIFTPGFSMSKTITAVSGRGVGMDVAKRRIENLRGSIDIESVKGKGATFVMTLPLTLAIIDGLLVKVGEERYVVPLTTVEEFVELRSRESALNLCGDLLNIRGEAVPFFRLRERFDVSGELPGSEQVIINKLSNQRVGIAVDRVIGEYQIVVKSVKTFFQQAEEFSGATILSDGSVALILDIPKLTEEVDLAYAKAA